MTTSATAPQRCLQPRHRHQEFLSFLRRNDKEVPKELDLHLIVDNYCTHKHAKVKAWLAQRPQFHVHYTPTYGAPGQRALKEGASLRFARN
jgi:hypothetical protein